MEREDGRGVAKQPDLNELDAPEWAEVALNTAERTELLQPQEGSWRRGANIRFRFPPFAIRVRFCLKLRQTGGLSSK